MKSLLLATLLLTGCATDRFPLPDDETIRISRTEWENARIAAELLNR